MITRYFFAGLCFISIAAQAQQINHRTRTFTAERRGVVNVNEIKTDYVPILEHHEMPKPGIATEADEQEMQAIKAHIHRVGTGKTETGEVTLGTLSSPKQELSFEGNAFGAGWPNDNDMAISNGGYVVSVINSTMNVYDSTGKLLKTLSLDAFGNTLGLKFSKYDPRALYDPIADRFIVAYLNGQNDSTSFITFAFSQTNNPTGAWNLYTISGNPDKDTTWSDYPIIALTKDELFLTINSLQDNKSWQAGFQQSYIWQVDKKAGFAGKSLTTKLHDQIAYNGVRLRNICPVQGGSALYGPEEYFVSSRNFSLQSDSIFFLKLSGLLSDSTSKLNVSLLRSATGKYGMPPSAHQPTNNVNVKRSLQTNDARVLDAVIENNTIHFVGNTVIQGTGLAGVFHGMITNADLANPSLNIDLIGGGEMEFGYPSIAYAGMNSGDDDYLISFDQAADTSYPGNAIVYYNNGAYSDVHQLYKGNSFIFITSKDERWGDYSGAQRRYDHPGSVWVAATYSKKNTTSQGTTYGYATRISSVSSPVLAASVNETQQPELLSADVFPNPAAQYTPLQVKFNLKKESYLTFTLYNMNGKLVSRLMNERVEEGQSTFSFNTYSLNRGIYFLKIDNGGRQVLNKKIVVE
jgi:hypothetical protein